MEKKSGIVKAITVGGILIFGFLWLYYNAGALFENQSDAEAYQKIMVTYIVGMAFIFALDSRASDKTERPLFDAPFLSRTGLLLYVASFVITLAVLYVFGLFLRAEALPTIFDAVSRVGIGVILLHIVIVSFPEELIFRGRLVNELRNKNVNEGTVYLAQSVLFAAFHFYASGGSYVTMALYIPLGYAFLAIKDKFSPVTNMANAGAHAAWNLFILGFLRAAGG